MARWRAIKIEHDARVYDLFCHFSQVLVHSRIVIKLSLESQNFKLFERFPKIPKKFKKGNVFIFKF